MRSHHFPEKPTEGCRKLSSRTQQDLYRLMESKRKRQLANIIATSDWRLYERIRLSSRFLGQVFVIEEAREARQGQDLEFYLSDCSRQNYVNWGPSQSLGRRRSRTP